MPYLYGWAKEAFSIFYDEKLPMVALSSHKKVTPFAQLIPSFAANGLRFRLNADFRTFLAKIYEKCKIKFILVVFTLNIMFSA